MESKQSDRHKDQVQAIEKLLGNIESKLKGDFKFTVGDYIRLLQFHEELENDAPHNIEVTWTESFETSDTGR